MRQARHFLSVTSDRPGLREITNEIAAWLADQPIDEGLLTVYIRHTSASLVIQENADPDVLHDLERFFARLVPEDTSLYRHNAEGPDDMPAHIKGALTQTQLSIPVTDRRMLLGRWQGVYLYEHRNPPRQREMILHLVGD